MKIADICKNNGINEVYVSGLLCRQSYQQKVNEINNLLCENKLVNDYLYINIDRIGKKKY